MKYNLLPESYHDRFDELEVDWTEMSNTKFLSEAQKCEASDKKERMKKKAAEATEKSSGNKRKNKNNDDDSTANLSRSNKQRNGNYKKARNGQKQNNQGTARFCELCKLSGAPEFVYTNHNTSNCNKKAEIARKLSGNAASRQKATKEVHRTEQQLKRELKLLQKIKKLKQGNKKSKKDDDDADMSSISSDDTNVSY
jgi:hypothetical protein